ncbi:family 43 glycosylhydrolase [bacterium]|nr:family 43 glycosylhydrolase [bacterium]
MIAIAIPVILMLHVMFSTRTEGQTGSVTDVHDPCIIGFEDQYYIYCTGDKIQIRRSRDLILWEYLGKVFNSIPAWGIQEVPGVSNVWAPDISYFNGIYHLYYALSTFGSNRSCIGLATNATLDPGDADYHWVDQGKVFESYSGDNYNAIDANIVRSTDGKIWMSFGSFWSGIKMVELDSTTGKPVNSDLYHLAGRGGGAIEAPFIIYKDGYYYLFISFDLCCRGVNSTYNIRVGRSETVTGPYVDSWNMLMTSGGGTLLLSGNSRWKGPGHCAVLSEGAQYWLVYHVYDVQRNGRPVLRINNLIWDDSGWPVVQDTLYTEVTEKHVQPSLFYLYPNYPNPFNQDSVIHYQLPAAGHVKMTVFDVLGRVIDILVNERQEGGVHGIRFQGADCSSGIYFIELRFGECIAKRKMILMK